MKAVRVHEFGGPEVLVHEEVPDPAPGPGEVVVDLAVADVIFLDTLLRGGWGEDAFPLVLPYIPGVGGAGRVRSVGDGVDPAWIGRLVAAARGQQKLELARERGADVTVDYSEPGWPQRVRDATGGAGAYVTFDGGSNGLTEIDPDLAARRRVSVRYALAGGPPDAETARALVQRVLDAASEGRIVSPVGARFPLAEAEQAHIALAERRVVGKALLVI